MGRLTYDSSVVVDFDDRTLVHLQLVIGAKFRRGESFYFSWSDDQAAGGGRSVLWMNPTIPLGYKFLGGKPAVINRSWVDELMATANSPAGLKVMAEPVETTRRETEPML